MVLFNEVLETNGEKKYDGIYDAVTHRLNPCPWCNGKIFCVRQYDSDFAFECHNDECIFDHSKWFLLSELEESIEKWNNRKE